MKLGELAEIRAGIKIPMEMRIRARKVSGESYEYLVPGDFIHKGGQGERVLEKDLRKMNDFSRDLVIGYGDYLLFRFEGNFKVFRYNDPTGGAVPSDDFVIIRSNFSIVKEFFGYEKNRNYFLNEIRNIFSEDKTFPDIMAVAGIEIMAENIRELEEANLAEKMGLMEPLDLSKPINLTQKPLPLDKLMKRIKNKELLLDSEFQRRPGLWDIGVKSRLIETMIIGLPIPAFYFDGNNDDEWLVIDGLQRLSAVYDFISGGYKLKELSFQPELVDKSFEDLTRPQQRKIEEYEVFAYILNNTPKSITYRIFKNINTSALILESQEIRHAINPGVPAQYLKEIAETEWFQNFVPMSERMKERMFDRETILRFIAFQRFNFRTYKPSIVDFLDKAMTDIYEIPAHARTLYKEELEDILTNINKLYDTAPFSRSIAYHESKKAYGHNNIIFELLTYGFSKIPREKRAWVVKNPETQKMISAFFIQQPPRFWEHDFSYSQDNLIRRFEGMVTLMKRLQQ